MSVIASPQLPTAPAVVREQPGGDTMRAIILKGFGGQRRPPGRLGRTLEAKPSRVFSFDEIHEAHRVMEAGEAGGKMVVVMER
jgi:hypothetical protein